jgi:hypothetical protein
MIAPTGSPQSAIVQQDRGWGFTHATYIWQGAGKFAVPGLQRVQSAAAVAKAKTIIGAGNNIDEAARWAGIGIVVGREDSAGRSDAQAERVPKASGPALEFRAVLGAAEEIAPFALARDDAAIRTDEAKRRAVIFAHADEERTIGGQRDAFQTVVRISVGGVKLQNGFSFGGIGRAFVGVGPEELHFAASNDIDGAIGPDQ